MKDKKKWLPVYGIVITVLWLGTLVAVLVCVNKYKELNASVNVQGEIAGAEEEEATLDFVIEPDANTRESYNSVHHVLDAQQIATGKGVKVGILDWYFGFKSGCGLYAGGADFMTFEGHEENFNKDRGHGYWMASTLHEIAPDAGIYAIGTFYLDDETKWVDSLIDGIDWAIDNDIDILTLSHQQISDENRDRFDEAVNRAIASGIVTTFIHYDNPNNLLPYGLWERNDPGYNREPDVNIFQYDYNITYLNQYLETCDNITFKDTYKDQMNLSMSSMSVVTAGFVAMLMEKDDSLTPKEYKEILRNTSRSVEYDGDTGAHTVDILAALQSME